MSNYWQDRISDSLARIAKKSTRQIEKQLKKYYRAAMEQTIEDFEATYNKLLATMEEGREPTPADLFALSKYWKMQGQLKDRLQKLGDKQAALLSKEFELNFFEVYYSFSEESLPFFSTIDEQGAQQLINQIWVADNKSWSKRIWENTAKLAETLNEKLVECVVGGKKTSDLKKALIERFGVSYNNADMLARTELAHIQTQAAEQRYKDSGVEWVQIWAPKDERQCKVCGKLHKTKYRVGVDKIPLPAHPRCRCGVIPFDELASDKTFTNTCEDCGRKFETHNEGVKVCPECKQKRRNQYKRIK